MDEDGATESADRDLPGVCVPTPPEAAGENATRTLLEILAAVSAVSLVTADLPAESAIRDGETGFLIQETDPETLR